MSTGSVTQVVPTVKIPAWIEVPNDFIWSGDPREDIRFLKEIASGTRTRFYITLQETIRRGVYQVTRVDTFTDRCYRVAIKPINARAAKSLGKAGLNRYLVEQAAAQAERLGCDFRPDLAIHLSKESMWAGPDFQAIAEEVIK